MRAGSIALILSGLLASTAAGGIVLWNSYQHEAGSGEIAPELDASADIKTDDATTLARSDAPLMALQYDEDLLNEIQAFDPARSVPRLPVDDFVSPTMKPLSIDMGFAHSVHGAATGTRATMLAYSTPPSSSALATPVSMRWGGAMAGGVSKNPNTGSNVTDEVDEPGPADDEEQPTESDQTPDESNNEGGDSDDGSNGSIGDPTKPTDPVDPNDPGANPPVSVPEPGTLGLLALGMAGLLVGRRKSHAPIVR